MRLIYQHRLIALGTALCLLANGGLWLYLSSRLAMGEQDMPVHYNIYYGIDLVADWWYLYGLPAAGFAIFCANAFLAGILEKRQSVTAYLVTGANLAVQAGLFFAAYLIISNV